MGISDVTESVPLGFGQNGDGLPFYILMELKNERDWNSKTKWVLITKSNTKVYKHHGECS